MKNFTKPNQKLKVLIDIHQYFFIIIFKQIVANNINITSYFQNFYWFFLV